MIELPIRMTQESCRRTSAAARMEWLETNGLGGFASGTVAGMRTRRYHGLLTAALQPPVGRHLLLAKFEEALVIDGERFEFSCNAYPGVIHPDGARYLVEFRLDPFPVFVYQMAGMELEKRIFLVHGENTVVVEYELRTLDRDPAPDCGLELVPLCAFRDYHATAHANDSLSPQIHRAANVIGFRPYADLPPLYISHSAADVQARGDWYYHFELNAERERGLDFDEDLFAPAVIRFDLSRQPYAAVIASLDIRDAGQAATLRRRECERRAALVESLPSREPLVEILARAADQFIVRRGEGATIMAGYPWFSDWGRDTMIALPGLTLATGRYREAKHILATFAGAVDQGMLPNRFPDDGQAPELNTVDGTLWYFEAVRAYLEHTQDYAFVRQHIFPKLKQILHWHWCGTRYGIVCDGDGLLKAGEAGQQLTWMDAKVGDWVVTPRSGKPVEIQALWYNALCIAEDLAERFGDRDLAVLARETARQAKKSFREKFWNPVVNCLHDVIDGEERDGSIRPNQILAVSLPYSMLDPEQSARVVECVRRDLLTPLGLRTLCPRDPRYRGAYTGGVSERDTAYHLGTVWPWLLGPFFTALLKVNGYSDKARREVRLLLEDVEAHLLESGLGQVSEIADGNYPHTPRGCTAQAWSVAELLRVCLEELAEVGQRGISEESRRISSAA